MTDIAEVASSALNAYSLKQSVTALNIAKLNTSDSAASSVVMQSINNGGASASVAQTGDRVDISKEAIDLATSGNAFKANLKVMKASNEMDKELFSIKA